MQQQLEDCQAAEQPLDGPVVGVEPAPLADQNLFSFPHIMEDDSEDVEAPANAPPAPPHPSSSAATTHSAAPGLADEEAETGSDVISPPEVSEQQDSPRQDEETPNIIIVEAESSSSRPDMRLHDEPLDEKPISSGRFAGEQITTVRALETGEVIILAPWVRPALLRAIKSMMPQARMIGPGEVCKAAPGMDIKFQSFARILPEPEIVSVDALTEIVDAGPVIEADDVYLEQNQDKDQVEVDLEGKEEEQEANEEEVAPPQDQASSSTSPAKEEPMPEIEVAWEKHPERPLQKLPIRFYDAVGRHYIWPWHKAKNWTTAKRLIESAFTHVDILGPHVMEGHYDLIIRGAFADNDSAAVSRKLSSYPPQPLPSGPRPPPAEEKVRLTTSISTVAVIAPDDNQPGEGPTAQPVSNSQALPPTDQKPAMKSSSKPPKKRASPIPRPPSPPPSGIDTNKGYRGATLLPELWDDIIEPGMVIQMHMWPMVPLRDSMPPPPPRLGGSVGMRPMRPGFSGPPPLPPGMRPIVPAPPGLIISPYKPPKGKTRKRQDGL